MNNKDLTYFTVEEISTPRDGYQVLVNHWWALSFDNKVILYKKYSPQCNFDKRCAEYVSKRLYSGNVIQIPLAFIPIDHRY